MWYRTIIQIKLPFDSEMWALVPSAVISWMDVLDHEHVGVGICSRNSVHPCSVYTTVCKRLQMFGNSQPSRG